MSGQDRIEIEQNGRTLRVAGELPDRGTVPGSDLDTMVPRPAPREHKPDLVL